MKPLRFRIWDKNLARYVGRGDGFRLALGLNGECHENRYWYDDADGSVDDDCWTETRRDVEVEQWTGITDSAGQDIYDGDVVDGTIHGTLEEPDEKSRIVVRWSDDRLRWEAWDPFNNYAYELGDYSPLDYVVGNRREHGHLLPPLTE